jgi:hypothetical protein
MASSEESRLDSALRRGLKGIEGLPESAHFADENITRYLKQKLGELLLSEYRKMSYRNEDEAAIAERANQVLDDVVLDAQKLYSLFELHMDKEHDRFWENLGVQGKGGGGEPPAGDAGNVTFSNSYSTGAPLPPAWRRRFYCTEGCLFEGEQAYLEHRDRGHHPVPL